MDNMDLKEFITSALSDIIEGIDEVDNKSLRRVSIATLESSSSQAVKFDIAVCLEKKDGGNAGIKVLSFCEVSGGVETKNIAVNRIQFGVYISSSTKKEELEQKEIINNMI